jgi:hypothetical protein
MGLKRPSQLPGQQRPGMSAGSRLLELGHIPAPRMGTCKVKSALGEQYDT